MINRYRPTVLIVCTGNSCRGPMAEGLLRHYTRGWLNVQSAGSQPAGYVHLLAIQVMAEIGLDISSHRSQSWTEFMDQPVETVITVCDEANALCPVFPCQTQRHHWPFSDPVLLPGTDQEKLARFRLLRDEMRPVFLAYAAGRLDESGVATV